ncbi:hypothetical protein [Noviherbaspirillum sedimenti]|uniref:Lipoprotein n=1 Tax=Noviherbaspirillum sedimenti TaxID=2320865 RepID=A0A3A3GI38_9BURK|nr:hypothetical protein [Noviherbaspirillum sedimenti]RJG01936.1 hypothetical protein D3878_10385 [Noviherbaspirillum sedimenti]
MKQKMRMVALLAGTAAALALSGCATDMNQTAPAAAAPAAAPAAKPAAPVAEKAAVAAPSAKEFFIILPASGRIHAFGDTRNYLQYLANGEVALTRTQIGTGPKGETVVYGITSDDVKKNQPSLGELVYQDKLPAAEDFHGEVFKNGRFYVFGNLQDMKAFAAFGEVPYSYTDIGAGPKGETLVWVMNKDSYKKGRPLANIERFKQIRAAT